MGTSIYIKYPVGSDFDGKKVLNIGCGFAQYKKPNIVNMDAYDICKPDVLWDANKVPLPFEDETFDLIIANHIMEHLENWWECFCDMSRILKTGGRIEIYVPSEGTDSQLGYRDHVSKINQYSFYGISDLLRPATNAWASDYRNQYVERLSLSRFSTVMENNFWTKLMPQKMKDWCCKHLRNITVEDIYFFKKLSEQELKLKKGIVWEKR